MSRRREDVNSLISEAYLEASTIRRDAASTARTAAWNAFLLASQSRGEANRAYTAAFNDARKGRGDIPRQAYDEARAARDATYTALSAANAALSEAVATYTAKAAAYATAQAAREDAWAAIQAARVDAYTASRGGLV